MYNKIKFLELNVAEDLIQLEKGAGRCTGIPPPSPAGLLIGNTTQQRDNTT